MRVETEAHLQLINRFRRDPGGEDLVQAFEGIVVALKAADTGLDGEAGLTKLVLTGQARLELRIVKISVTFARPRASDFLGTVAGERSDSKSQLEFERFDLILVASAAPKA